MTIGTQELINFYSNYNPRAPIYPNGRIPIECIPITGFQRLSAAPATNIQPGNPPVSKNELGANTYIWVIDQTGVPYIIEAGIGPLQGAVPKHTNLTGDKAAYLGGQLWFKNKSFLYVSGGSGRYPPVCERQLQDAVKVFEDFSYRVESLGWDEETGAKRYLEVT